jgi:hypothetical protein
LIPVPLLLFVHSPTFHIFHLPPEKLVHNFLGIGGLCPNLPRLPDVKQDGYSNDQRNNSFHLAPQNCFLKTFSHLDPG